MAKPKAKAPPQVWPWPIQTALDLVNGKHELSSALILVAWLAEIFLVALIIWKIPCATDPPFAHTLWQG